MTLSVLTFAVTWAGCLTLAVAGAFSLGDRQQPIGEFDIGALYAALDERRSARGISWQQVTREINARFDGMPLRPVSASTLRTLREHAGVEGDGVLQMLLWLNRTPESFVRPVPQPRGNAALPDVGPGKILRFDTRSLHAALDAQRVDRGMTWQQVADQIGGISPASLTRLAKGGRTTFPQVMRMTGWLGRPAADFTRASDQ